MSAFDGLSGHCAVIWTIYEAEAEKEKTQKLNKSHNGAAALTQKILSAIHT